MDLEQIFHPLSDAQKNHYRVTFQSNLTSYLGHHHTNRTGFYINHLGYDLNINQASGKVGIPDNLFNEQGTSNLLQFTANPKLM